MTTNTTRHFSSTQQEQRCLLSMLGSCCTSVTSKLKLFAILCLFCYLFVSVVLFFLVDVSFWKHSWAVGFARFVGNRRNIPVKLIHGNSPFDSYINSWRKQEPLKIAIWTSPKLDMAKYRRGVVEKFIVSSQNENPCFRDKFKCTMTMDTGELETADAIIFFMFNKGFLIDELPPGWEQWRKPDQIWILHGDEAPPQIPTNKSDLPEVFNWSISYRRDSDIWLPYGRVVPIEQTGSKEDWTKGEIFIGNVALSEWISGKSELVAGVVSNCYTSSRREKFVEQLKRTGRPVHIYGGGDCTDFKLNCNFYEHNCSNFWSQLGAIYKFYLAFENSLCVDYITEKFWRTLEFGMVPVVYGGANYSQVMPPGSFIDVRDFGSSGELMSYLEKVARNDTKYAQYFEWRRKFKLAEGNSWNNGNAWCELCEKLRKFKYLYYFGDKANNMKGSRNAFKKKLSAQLGKNWWKNVPGKYSKRGKNACTNATEFQRFLGNNVLLKPKLNGLLNM